MYEIIVLKEGYTRPEPHGTMRACGSITLLRGPKYNIMVDTGNPWDREALLKELTKHGLKPQNIDYVVCTGSKMSQTGNLNLFTSAVHLVAGDICKGDLYQLHGFREGIPYEIDEDVEIWPTPGHTGSDVTVVVKNTNFGTVAVAGDLFECEADLDCPSLWQDNSERPHLQEQSRIDILRVADFIIPGHGAMFQVPNDYKQQMRVVMFVEEQFTDRDLTTTTKTECIIVETD